METFAVIDRPLSADEVARLHADLLRRALRLGLVSAWAMRGGRFVQVVRPSPPALSKRERKGA